MRVRCLAHQAKGTRDDIEEPWELQPQAGGGAKNKEDAALQTAWRGIMQLSPGYHQDIHRVIHRIFLFESVRMAIGNLGEAPFASQAVH